MRARRKKQIAQKRQLVVSSLYGVYTVLAVSNIIVNRNALTSLDVALLTPAFSLLASATTHGLGRSIYSFFGNEGPGIRPSTHNIANAIMHFLASGTFITYDSLILAGVSPLPSVTSYGTIAARTVGLGLWNVAADTLLFHAIAHDRHAEDHPDEDVYACGLHPETYNLFVEVLLLTAAVLFAVEFYTENPVNPFKASALIFWFLAGGISTFSAGYDFHHRNDVDEPEVVITLPPEAPQNDCVVDITDTAEAEALPKAETPRPGT